MGWAIAQGPPGRRRANADCDAVVAAVLHGNRSRDWELPKRRNLPPAARHFPEKPALVDLPALPPPHPLVPQHTGDQLYSPARPLPLLRRPDFGAIPGNRDLDGARRARAARRVFCGRGARQHAMGLLRPNRTHHSRLADPSRTHGSLRVSSLDVRDRSGALLGRHPVYQLRDDVRFRDARVVDTPQARRLVCAGRRHCPYGDAHAGGAGIGLGLVHLQP